ncbi:hypothetical protein PQO03_08120 [Lentisphaera profundi]|uniref:Histidine kinase N-terminal 7TM region domain-containing protein n=1 Tax=Lentisphaera profundi TaxID=1658616 RepID=A0ABY7VS47_9BACT|nr:hypothetical protein [Lentisphaera profundi]WDE95681.1 hypothetical protein PQO03_08120 [Lentisphaera profundi]
MSNIYSFLPFVAFLSNAVLLGVGLHRGMTKRVHRDYVYFMACVTVWTFGDFINWNWSQMPHEFTMTIYRLQVPSYIFLAYFFMRFIYSLVGKAEDWFYKSFYVIPLTVSFIGVFTPYMVYSYTPVWWGLRHEPGVLFIPAAIICIFAPAQYALCILLNFKTAKDKNERSQRKLMVAGCCFVLYVGMYTDLVAPHFMGEGATIQAAGSTVAIMAYCMHLAISKYYMLPFSFGSLLYELFQSSEQGVLIVNSKEEVTDLNPVALRMFSLDVAGQYQSDTRHSLQELIPEVVESDFGKRVQIIRERNGQDIVLKLHINKHTRVAENESGWVIIATDTTKEYYQLESLEGQLAQVQESAKKTQGELKRILGCENKESSERHLLIEKQCEFIEEMLIKLIENTDQDKKLSAEYAVKLKNYLFLRDLFRERAMASDELDVKTICLRHFQSKENVDGLTKVDLDLPKSDCLILSSKVFWSQLFSLLTSLLEQESNAKKLRCSYTVASVGLEKRLKFSFIYPCGPLLELALQKHEDKQVKSFEIKALEQLFISLEGSFEHRQKNDYEREIYFEMMVSSKL